MEVFRVDDENLKRQPGVFKLAGIFPSGGESRYRWAMEEFRVVPIAKNGGLVVTILQTAGRYIDGMRDILRALYIMSVLEGRAPVALELKHFAIVSIS